MPRLLAIMKLIFGLANGTHMNISSLLFFFCSYTLVWRSEAECPRPQRGNTSVLAEEVYLMNQFPEGTNVTLVCRIGLVKRPSSDAIFCKNGSWTPIEIICEKFNCEVPRPRPNMIFNTTGGTLFGDVAKVTCEKGYQMRGTSYWQCYRNGWVGKSQCLIRKCKLPLNVDNGMHFWASSDPPTYGESVKYQCDKGYVLTGNATIQCSETGGYDSPPPECKDISTSASPTSTASTSSPSSTEAAAPKDKIITHHPEVTMRQEIHDKARHRNKDFDYLLVIVGVVFLSIVGSIGAICLHRHFFKRKGSYNTSEELKPKLFIFQNA
ncbi:complement decay-accelerating factor, GPI-anchored [Stigmatopora nigra]